MLDQFRLSVRPLSVTLYKHCENGERLAYCYYGKPIGIKVTTVLLGDPIFNPFLVPKLGSLHRKLRPNGARYNSGLYWQPMGTSSPYPTVLSSTIRVNLPQKTCRASAALLGFHTFLSTNIPHSCGPIHIGIPAYIFAILYETRLSLTPAFSTPAIWCHVFHSRVFSRPYTVTCLWPHSSLSCGGRKWTRQEKGCEKN